MVPVAAFAVVALWPGPSVRSALAAQERSKPGAPAGALVAGQVVDHETDTRVPGALVSLAAGPAGVSGRGTRVTDDDGRFRFEDVPEGTYRLSVTAPGYRSMRDTLPVPAEADLDLVLPLSTDPIRLEPIIVTAERSPFPMRGYERRRRGGGARFLITREEIEKRSPRYLSELLHRVPGGMVVPTPPHGYTLLLRGQCRPGIWVDGVQDRSAHSVDQLISPQEVEAVEVYQGFELPVEFGVDACGGILIWTRRGPSPSSEPTSGPRSGILGQLLKVAAIVLLVAVVVR